MKDVIEIYLKQYGILSVMSRDVIESSMNYYRIIFKDLNMRCRKLEVFYNDVGVLGQPNRKDSKLIGNGDIEFTLRDRIYSMITTHDSYEDAYNKSISGLTPYRIEKIFSKYATDLADRLTSYSSENIKVTKAIVQVQGVPLVVVHYTYKEQHMKPIMRFIGEPYVSGYHDEEIYNLIDFINDNIAGGFDIWK